MQERGRFAVRQGFEPFDDGVVLRREGERASLEEGNSSDATLLRIANSANWLLQNPSPGNELESLRHRYLGRAMDLGYVSAQNCIRWSKLIPEFRSRYSEQLLAELYCSLPINAPKNRDHWLANLLHHQGYVQAPIRHLLLMDFLGLSSEQFLNAEHDHSMFGIGPWPCENPTCSKHGQSVITEMRYEPASEHVRPAGSFGCPVCGQVRARLKTDSGERSWVRDYGDVWKATLRELWLDPSVLLSEIAKRLGVAMTTVEAYADELGLPFPRPGPNRTTGNNGPSLRLTIKKRIEQKRCERRAEWVGLRTSYPAMSITELIMKSPNCYAFLHKHDREWLHANSPARRRRAPVQPVVDWSLRDQQLSQMVIQAVRELRLQDGAPDQVTISAIGRRIGRLAMIQKYWSKLPLTKAALDAGIESTIEFGLRKVFRQVRCMRQEGLSLNAEQLIRRAKLSAPTARNPIVVEAIQAELSRHNLESLAA